MDLYELFNTPIDELYEMGVLKEPEPERNVKMCTLTYTCCICGDVYTERYARNNPDKCSRGLYCTACNTPTMFLEQAVPFTLHYRSRGMEYGSFCDDVSSECWECGSTERLYPLAFSNGQEVKICSVHLREFAKEACKAAQRKRECLGGTIGKGE